MNKVVDSANEAVADMLTDDLRYLLVEHYRAALVQRTGGGDRYKQVVEAKACLEAFVRACELKGLVSDHDLALLGAGDGEPAPGHVPYVCNACVLKCVEAAAFRTCSCRRRGNLNRPGGCVPCLACPSAVRCHTPTLCCMLRCVASL